MTEKEAYIAFNMTEGVGSVKLSKLVSCYGNVVEAWQNYPDKVARSQGVIDYVREQKLADNHSIYILTPADDDYPEILRKNNSYPLALYVKGNVKALSKPSLSIVGTRRATDYGLAQAEKFAYALSSDGWSIVSGLALGIDAAAHRGALDANGITVGIIGSALDKFFPEDNLGLAREMVSHNGAVVSEFPFGKTPDETTFPQRNRIIAALSCGVIAIETPLKGGTLITTSYAADMGKTVMALPGRVDSRSSAGCLKLLREGARPVRNARDVQEEMSDLFGRSPISPAKNSSAAPKEAHSPFPEPAFDIDESIFIRYIGTIPVSLDTIAEKTKFSAAKINSIAMGLRLKGRLKFCPGNKVALLVKE